MKYRTDLNEDELPLPPSNHSEAELYVERLLQEFEILREIWENERKY
jgi:hypothetical protein